MPFRSLRARLFVIQSALLVGLTLATVLFVSVLASRAVRGRAVSDLTESRQRIAAADADRYRRLRLVAELLASFPELRALLATDTATIRDFLSDFRERHGRDELLIALAPSGEVVARSDTFASLAIPDVQSAWVQPALQSGAAAGLLTIDTRIYQGTLAAAESGGTVFGFILAAAPVDDAWARVLRDASNKEIVILSPHGLAGTTLAATRLPWRSAADFSPAQSVDEVRDVDLDGERFQAVVAPAAIESPLRILSLQSLDRALAPYRRIQWGLLLLGLVAIAFGIGGSAMMGNSLTTPLRVLSDATRQIAAGNFDVRLPAERRDEIGELARSFNVMTEGLRERADMQKFVSQSTVDMIRGHEDQGQAAGARRSITLLFSDIRAFTAFTEMRPPEEGVAVLNRYLRLQADLVKEFHGDVDKFIGDAVFAHFTSPDMAMDAIRCAFAIQNRINAAAATDPTLPALAVGIGIATGDVIVGSIGSSDRRDFTAIGPAVNLAARLCATADAHEILISEGTFAMVRGLVAAEPIPPLAVKGFTTAVQAYKMTVRPPV